MCPVAADSGGRDCKAKVGWEEEARVRVRCRVALMRGHAACVRVRFLSVSVGVGHVIPPFDALFFAVTVDVLSNAFSCVLDKCLVNGCAYFVRCTFAFGELCR